MNMARHLAWMLNPNLTEEQVLALVKADCAAEERRISEFCDQARARAAEIREEHGKLAAQQYLLEAASRAIMLLTL